MSIEAIKEALAAVQPCGQWHRSGAAVDVDESEDWAHARIEVKANKLINRKLSAFIAACNPVAIRSLIERLEAAEAENAQLIAGIAKCRDAIPIPECGSEMDGLWCQAMGHPLDALAYIAAAMAGGLAEGVSDD